MGEETIVTETTAERDLGVVVANNGKWEYHVSSIVSRANRMLGLFLNTFENYTPRIAKVIYPTFIRPHLEFAVDAWNPHLKQDINSIESVQRRATRAVRGLKRLPYETRLAKMGITRLDLRRKRGDLIQLYKIIHGFDRVDWPIFRNTAPFSGYQLRSHNHQIQRELTRSNVRHNFLMNRIANEWNSLPRDVIDSPNVNVFKARLDKYTEPTK